MAFDWKGESLSTFGDLHRAQQQIEGDAEGYAFLLAYASDLEAQGLPTPISTARGNLAYLRGY